MNAAELRAAFKTFAGEERYRNFVRAVSGVCRRKGRLMFWQEELWKEFASTFRAASQLGDNILVIFCVCDVHDLELMPPPDNLAFAEIRSTSEYAKAWFSLFPFATDKELGCASCWAEREKWISENCELCRILRRRTKCEDYCRSLLEGITPVPPGMEARISVLSAEIAAQMEPGDELWEWDKGGWHSLSGAAGLAIVRDGQIVKKWCLIRS